MSHLTHLFGTLSIAAALAGCGSTATPLQVNRGMSRGEVVATLGEPESVIAKDGVELMYYTLCQANCAAKGFENRRNVTYEIRLINGKVDSSVQK